MASEVSGFRSRPPAMTRHWRRKKIPWIEVYKGRAATLRRGALTTFDNPEQRSAIERCMSSNGVQTPAIAVIVSEFIHDARIIRMNGTHSPAAITSWLGDSTGWWENAMLVVETKYFAPNSSVRLNARYVFFISPETTVTERFTRVSRDELMYVFTVTDPTYCTRPWRGETHLMRSDTRMFEDACHEGNYSMRNILEAARAQDAKEASTGAPDTK